MLKNKRNIIILALIGVIAFYNWQIINLKKQINAPKFNKPTAEQKVEFKVDESISNSKKPGTKILPDFEKLDYEFYLNLKYCTPAELATNTQLEYSIYGIQDNKCAFQHRHDFYVLDCQLPLDINEKYAEEGLQISRELQDLKAQNKTGFVSSGAYINDINNNSGYCKSYSTQKKIRSI